MTHPAVATAAARFEADMEEAGSRCQLTRSPTGEPVYDPETGDITHPEPDVLYEGPCLLTPTALAYRVAERGGESEYVDRFQVSLPREAGPPMVGDRVTITANPALIAIVGVGLTVRQVVGGTHSARWRCVAEAITVGPRT